jgi:hypothetical protein
MYIYSSSGASGTVKVEDASGRNAIYSVTFNTATAGTYVATATADVTFTER